MGSAAGIQDIAIREFRMEDYPAVRYLWTEAGLPYRPLGRDHPERVAAECGRDTAVFLVAETVGSAGQAASQAGGEQEAGRGVEIVGVVFGTHDGRKGWINRLAVASAYQRQGIARRLVREVELRLEARGLDITAALIETKNESSMRFFESIGYAHDSEIEYFSKRRSADT